MDESRSVLVLDDGELDDILKLLRRLQIPFVHLRGQSIPAQVDPPGDLLISTARRAAAVPFSESDSGTEANRPVRIGIVEGAERHDRAQLRRSGFDYLVRRPVHPDAMRLLVQHALYKGTERRRDPRFAVGCEVRYETGLLSRRAMLLDLTSRSCRIHSRRVIGEDAHIRLVLPKVLTGGKPLKLSGRVVRCAREDSGTGLANAFAAAVAFDLPDRAARQVLAEILARIAVEPPGYVAPSEVEVPASPGMAQRLRSIPQGPAQAVQRLAGGVRRAIPRRAVRAAAAEQPASAEVEQPASAEAEPPLITDDSLLAPEEEPPDLLDDSAAAEEEEPVGIADESLAAEAQEAPDPADAPVAADEEHMTQPAFEPEGVDESDMTQPTFESPLDVEEDEEPPDVAEEEQPAEEPEATFDPAELAREFEEEEAEEPPDSPEESIITDVEEPPDSAEEPPPAEEPEATFDPSELLRLLEEEDEREDKEEKEEKAEEPAVEPEPRPVTQSAAPRVKRRAAIDPEKRAAAVASAFPWADQTMVDDLPAPKAGPKVSEVKRGKRKNERRRNPRGRFEQEVIAIAEQGSSRPLVGRDLSVSGMRVEPSPDLKVGDAFKIAVYASAREEPFFLRAKVVQDYGDKGLGLAFDQPKPVPAERLSDLVASLPAIESLRDPGAGSKPNVVCEIVPEDD